MGDFLTVKLKSKDPIAKVPKEFYDQVDAVLSNLAIDTEVGTIEKAENNWTIKLYKTEVSPLVNVELDANNKLKITKRKCYVLSAEDESTDYLRDTAGKILDGDSC